MSKKRAAALGTFITERREAKGLSIRALAKAAGTHAANILRMERGEYETPTPETLQNLARALDVAVEDFYALAGYMMPEGLPELAPYLRAKYDLSPKAVKELEAYFQTIKQEAERGEQGGRRGKRSG